MFLFIQIQYSTTQVQKKANKTNTIEQDIRIQYTATNSATNADLRKTLEKDNRLHNKKYHV